MISEVASNSKHFVVLRFCCSEFLHSPGLKKPKIKQNSTCKFPCAPLASASQRSSQADAAPVLCATSGCCDLMAAVNKLVTA